MNNVVLSELEYIEHIEFNLKGGYEELDHISRLDCIREARESLIDIVNMHNLHHPNRAISYDLLPVKRY